MAKQKNISKYFDYVDIPVIVFIGTAMGFFSMGFFTATFDSLIDAGKGELFSFKSIVAGMACIALSAVTLIIAYLYWTLVPKRFGAVYPAFTGFGTIIALMAMFSGLMLATELCGYLIYGMV